MSKIRRIGNIALSLVMVLGGILLLSNPDEALFIVAFALGVWLLLSGVKEFVYYFTMARHMVGGLFILLYALIAIDVGGFALLLINEPKFSVALYLVGYNLFTAIIGIVRVVESKMIDSHWRMSLFHSIVNIALAIACCVFITSNEIVIVIFCIGLFYSAAMRFITAIRPTEIVYIQ